MNVNGASLKQKSQSENSGRPVKKSRGSEDGQSTSKKYKRDDGFGEFSFSEGVIDVSFLIKDMWALKLDGYFGIVDSLELCFRTYFFGNDLFLPSSVKEERLLSLVH
jgi:hypothetical protein